MNIIFICYLNALVFTGILNYSCFICLDDMIIWLTIMQISIMQWRVEIRLFNINFNIRCKSNAPGPFTRLVYTIAAILITLLSIFLLLCGDVELNLGSIKKRNSWFNFSISHWNFNFLTAHSFEKVNFLEANSKQIQYNMSMWGQIIPIT